MSMICIKLDEMNKEFICFLTCLISFFLLLPKTCAVEVILMETNIIIKFPTLEIGGFLQFVGIWLLVVVKPVTNWVYYCSEASIYIFDGCSIYVNQLISSNFLKLSTVISSSLLPPLYILR